MGGKKYEYVLATVLALVLAVLLMWYIGTHPPYKTPAHTLSEWAVATSGEADPYAFTPSPNSTLIHFTDGMRVLYTNDALTFSFRLPDGFIAPEEAVSGGKIQTVSVTNQSGDDLFILAVPITSSGKAGPLTEADIQANIPKGTSASNFRPGSLKEGTEGLFFTLTSTQIKDPMLAFWFIHSDTLYEITTYQKDEELLALVMQTWHFGSPVLKEE